MSEITSIKNFGRKNGGSKAEWTQNHPIHSVLVSDADAIQACIQLADAQRVLVNLHVVQPMPPIKPHPAIQKARHIVVVICGGSVDTDMLPIGKEYRS